MATKPTDPVDWAESGTATDPAAKRTNGWLDNDTLPAANANYLWQALGRWVGFFGDLFSTSGALTQDVAGGSLVASTDGSTRDLDHVPDGDATFLSADNLRSRGAVYFGQATLAGVLGVLGEQISGLAGARSLQFRSTGTLATGLISGAIRVTEASPSTADMATLHPRISSLYQNNLIKAAATVAIEWDALGAYLSGTVEAGAHNVASGVLNTGTFPQQFELTLTEDFTPKNLQVSIVDASITSPQFSAALVTIPGSPDKIGIRLYSFGGGGFNDAFATSVTLANVTVRVSAIAL